LNLEEGLSLFTKFKPVVLASSVLKTKFFDDSFVHDDSKQNNKAV
jgi:hypothetical protein